MKRYICIIAACLAAFSCEQEPQPAGPSVSEGRVTLELSSDSRLLAMAEDGTSGEIHFKTKGGAVAIDVLTNQDEWTYETESADWLEVSADKYFLYLEAGRNEADKSDEAKIVVKAGEGEKAVSVTLTVRRNHSGVPEISLAENKLHVKAHTGLENQIVVETNQEDWEFECTCSWLLVEQKDGLLVLTADYNKTTKRRTTEIKVKAGEDYDWLTVDQDGTAFVRLSTQNLTTDDEGDTKSLTVTSNPELEWKAETDGSDWFDVAVEGSELSVTIQPNIGGNQRRGSLTIIVGDEDNFATAMVNVRQIGPDTEELIYEVLISEPDFYIAGAPVITSSTGGSVTVDWGDGTPKETFDSRRPTHVYAEPGRYTIEMTGEAKSLEFGVDNARSSELQSIISWGKMGYTNLADMCLGCVELKSIPNDVAGSFADVKTFNGAFSCCASLDEIPAGLFRHAALAKRFEDCFSHCASISSIPEDLFANCHAAEDFSYAFYATGTGEVVTSSTLSGFAEIKEMVTKGKLTEIPGGLFRNCPAVKQMDYIFGATSIKAVPEAIFASQSNATIFTGAFSACVMLDEVPAGFLRGATSATDIKYMFAGCQSLKTFPTGAFTSNTAVTNLEYIFYKTGFESLPGGIFEGLANVKTIGAVFQDCVNLKDISPELFKGLTSAKSFKYCFSGCTELRQIPSGLFAGLTKAYEFASTFEDTSLESIPADLFKDCRNYSGADFSYMLAGCMNLKTVPATLFETFTAVTSPGFKNTFEGSGIETVPAGLFSKNAAVSGGFADTFYGCKSLKTIEGPIFAETSSVTNLEYTFSGCSALEELPDGFFDSLAAGKTKFTSTFDGCSSLRKLPAGLFSKNVLTTQFTRTFRGCSSLEAVPEDLIGANEKLTTVTSMFADCSSLKSIPAALFAGTPSITTFEATFSGCSSLESIPETLFAAIGTKTTSITYSECFRNCSSLKSLPAGLFDTVTRINYIDLCFSGCTSLAGESPYTMVGDEKIHLYERERGEVFQNVPSTAYSHECCFAGCTGLTDYSEIPTEWK